MLPITSSLAQTASQFVSNASTLHATYLSDTATKTPPPPKDLSLRNISKPFGNTSGVVMLFSRWLSVPHTMSGWCSCSNAAKSSRFPVERRLQQFTVIIFSLCSFRLVGHGISRMSSVPVISVVPVVC